MLLYFLRHGEAEDGGPDTDRRLTAAGADTLRAAVRLWRKLDVRPDLVICSPLPRAAQTAQIASEGLDLGVRPRLDNRLEPGAGWNDMALAMGVQPDAQSVLFVGHDPDLSNAAAILTGASAIKLRKGGMVAVGFPGRPEPSGGELLWLLDPDLYTAADG